MDTLDKIYDMMYCELDDIAKKEKLDSKDVELIDKFVDIIKDINEIDMSQEVGYSSSYGNGSSYARGGNSNGRYNRSSYGRGSYGRGSYGHNMRGYSRDESKDIMLDHLQDVMNMAVDEKDRKAVSRLMDQMRDN